MSNSNRRSPQILLYVLALSLLVSFLLSSCVLSPAPPSDLTPTFRFNVVGGYGEDDQYGVSDFPCFSLTGDDFKDVLLPNKYWVMPQYKPESTECTIFSSLIVVAVSGFVAVPPSLDSVKTDWEPSFVYQFPDSFGWGGALWIAYRSPSGDKPWGSLPAPPAASDTVYAILCVDDAHCLLVTIDPDVSSQKYLAPNVNGVFDPIGIAVTLLEKAWRRLSVDRPDLVPISVPAVNPSPYVPLTTPPY